VSYPFQLRRDRWVTLLLPSDLTRADVERLIAYLVALADTKEEKAPYATTRHTDSDPVDHPGGGRRRGV
jgi:hypothetical protein